jgi:hypothetical protein
MKVLTLSLKLADYFAFYIASIDNESGMWFDLRRSTSLRIDTPVGRSIHSELADDSTAANSSPLCGQKVESHMARRSKVSRQITGYSAVPGLLKAYVGLSHCCCRCPLPKLNCHCHSAVRPVCVRADAGVVASNVLKNHPDIFDCNLRTPWPT